MKKDYNMRTVTGLEILSDIATLNYYLYMNEEHNVYTEFDGVVTYLQIDEDQNYTFLHEDGHVEKVSLTIPALQSIVDNLTEDEWSHIVKAVDDLQLDLGIEL